MKKLFLVLILALCSRIVEGQILSGSTLVHDSNANAISTYLIESFVKDLEKQLLEDHIVAYGDVSLTIPLSMVSAHEKFFTRENQTVINPENPDDPYDLIDTFIYYRIKPSTWQGISMNDSAIKISITDRQFFYIPHNSALLLRSYPILLNLNNHNVTNRLYFNVLPSIIMGRMDRLQWTIYTLMFQKNLPVYWSIDGSIPCNCESNVLSPCDKRMDFQVINPQNPEDIYDLIDTIVTTPASINCMSGILFGNTLNPNNVINLHSLSIDCESAYVYSYEQRWEGGKLFEYDNGRPVTWYWVLWDDIEKNLKPEDAELLQFLNIWGYLNPSP